MKRAAHSTTQVRREIVYGFAFVHHALEWANRQEEKGRTYPGQNILLLAPKRVDKYTVERSEQAVFATEVKNGMTITDIYAEVTRLFPWVTPSEFGNNLAIESVGGAGFELMESDVERYLESQKCKKLGKKQSKSVGP